MGVRLVDESSALAARLLQLGETLVDTKVSASYSGTEGEARVSARASADRRLRLGRFRAVMKVTSFSPKGRAS